MDARWDGPTGALYGITFGIMGDYDWFYWFAVSADTQRWALYRFEPDDVVLMAGPEARSAIVSGNGVNHLQVIRRGQLIDLFVNGERMYQTTDTTLHGQTAVGLAMLPYTGEPNADARFDNFMFELRPALNSEGELRAAAAPSLRVGDVAAGAIPMRAWQR
jgi:hypothetical protein